MEIDSKLTATLNSKVVLTLPDKDERTLEELTAEVADLRIKLGRGEDPTKDELRTIVSYYRLFRRKASEQSRATAAKKRGRARKPKLTEAEQYKLLDEI